MALPLSELLKELVSVNVFLSCCVVMLNPLLWNLAARLEYNKRVISRLCGGPRRGIVVLAVFIMGNTFLRTSLVHYMTDMSSKWAVLEDSVAAEVVGYLIIGVGGLLVLSSAWGLGFFCTFLGDYFGILLDARVTGFPFNIVNDPMYWGSFFVYLGGSIQCASAVALLLSLCIGLSYVIAMMFEGPFTSKIYAQREQSKKL